MSDAIAIDAVEAPTSSRLRSVAKGAGYSLFFLAALLVSLVWTFPNRQLKGFVEAQARKSGYPLSIEEMSLTGLGGVALEGVDLTLPAAKGKDGKTKKGAKATVVHLDTLEARVRVWPLLTRREVDAKFSLSVAGGGIEEGHVKLRQGRRTVAAKGKKKSAKKGKKATLIDVDIPAIDRLDLAKMGLDERALGFTDKVGGALRGNLSGAVKLHWEGTHEGARGTVDLELADAVLHKPTVSIDSKGPPLELKDLRLGVVTVKVRIDEKGQINLLKGKRGVDSATAIHLAGVDMFGPDIELVAEERSHVIIPPGARGMQRGRMQVHLVFALPKAKKAKKPKKAKAAKGDKDSKDDKAGEADAGRASWDLVREMMTGKFKRFMRSGYLGMTCSGSLSRPTCQPSLPQVTVGTRKRARSEARAKKAKKGQSKAKAKAAAAKAEAAKKAAEAARMKTAEAAKKAAEAAKKPKVEFKPAVRPGAKRKPTPRAAAKPGAVKVKQSGKKLAPADDEEEDDEGDEERDDRDREDDEDDEDRERDDEAGDGDKKRKAAKKKKARDDEDLEEEPDEEEIE